MSAACIRRAPAALAAVLAFALAPALARADNDIAVRAVTGPSEATIGHPVTLQVSLENTGTNPLSGYVLGVYLSPDTALSVFDRKLGEVAGPDLAVGAKVTVNATATIPANVTAGAYTLGIIADPLNTLAEKVGTLLDNVKGSSVRTNVKVPSPDFVATKVAWGLRAAGGEVVPVEFTIDNAGVLDGQASVSFYLSTNDTVTKSDQLVGSIAIEVAAGAELHEVAWVKLPGGIAPSRYYLGMWIDPSDQVTELNETNNMAVSLPADIVSASLGVETTYLPAALIGVPYVKSLVASGGDGPYTWRLASGSLPEGIGLSTAGVLTGTATVEGTYSPVFEVTSGSSTAQQALVLRAYAPTTSLQVLSSQLPPAVVDTDYAAPLAAVGGTAPYSWRVFQGSLPNGLSLTSDGIVKGKATKEDTQAFSVEVRDSAGSSAKRSLTLKALKTGDLAIQQLVLDDATAQEAYAAKLDPRGGSAPYTWEMASGRLPKGLAFSSDGQNSVQLTGKPLEEGTFTFSVRLEDATGQVDRNIYVLHVAAGTIKVLTGTLPDATRGQPYDEELTSDGRDPHWRVASGDVPPGFELTADGHLRAKDGSVPDTTPLRTYTFLVEVTDGEGAMGRAGMSVTILGAATSDETPQGCATAGLGVLALLPLALLARRRKSAAFLGILLAAGAARAQTAAEYFVAQVPETSYPEPASVWIDDVSLTVTATDGTPGPNLVANGDFADTTDEVTAAGGWGMQLGSALATNGSWMSCNYDATQGATAGPALRCLYSFGQTTSPAVSHFQVTQGALAFAAGDTLEAHYCLKGTVPNQSATVTLVDAAGAPLGLARTLTLTTDAFTCETQSFTAAAAGPGTLVVSIGDPLAQANVVDFGTSLDRGDADFAIPFQFSMFGTNHENGKIGTNGYLAFSGSAREDSNQKLPNSSTPNAVVAPWWDDLELNALPTGHTVPASMVLYKTEGTTPNRVFVAEWRGIEHYNAGSGSAMTFQLRLGENGSLEFHYRTPRATLTGSHTATAGVEDDNGTAGVLALGCADKCAAGDYPGGKALKFVKQSELQVSALTGPLLAYGDLNANFSVSARNAGSLPASGVVTRVYLSSDRELDPATDRLVWEVGPVNLDRGETKSFSDTVHIPADLSAGAYYPIAIVDPDGAVTEADETNNVKVGEAIRVGAPAPDFSAGTVTISATTADAGSTATVTGQVKNQGNRPGTCPWRVVLSLNDVLSVADRTIAEGSIDLDAGAAQDLVTEVTLPADLAPGIYRVGIILDAADAPAVGTPEIDEFNNVGKSQQTLTVRGPVAIETTDLPPATAGAAYGFRLRASGGDGLYLWTLADGTRLPAGLTLTPFGDVEGVPTQVGSATFTVQLTSNQTQTAKKTYTLAVGAPVLVLSFVTTQLPAAIYGREYETHLTAAGGTAPYKFSLVTSAQQTGLPAGLAFDPNGIIGGVPVSGGDFTLTVQVEDKAGTKASRDLVLHVLPPGRPVIDARPLPEALLGAHYATTLTAIGGRAPYAWTLEKVRRVGTLGQPTADLDKVPGLDLAADGTLTGTPRELGLYALIVRVTDAGTAVDRDTLLLEVRAEHGLAILTSELPTATVDKDYDELVVAAGSEGLNVTFALMDEGQALPDGLALHDDGHVQGRPTTTGRRTFVVKATDEAGRVDYRALTLEVKAPPAPRQASESCASGGVTSLALLALLPFLLRRRKLAVALSPVLVVGLAAVLSACGTPPPRSPCAGVSCQPGEQCDVADGICKCGGAAGRACTSEESCNPQSLQCELLDRCRLVSCTRGMTCDPSDGTCRCAGTQVCGEGEICDGEAQRCVAADRCASVTCSPGLLCDPADGQCKCGGEGGVVCEPGQRCVPNEDGTPGSICKADPCASIACTGGESCDPADGQCKCGGAGGEMCLYGQTCDPTNKRCVQSSRCATVRCTGSTSCDPADGQCKCGGAGGPVCVSGQTCDLATFACVGGNRCFNKTCPANTECDPEDGECHCGTLGPVCGPDQSCDATTNPKVCRTNCDPVAQTPCGTGDGCTYNLTSKVAFCGHAGTKAEGATCTQSTECARGMHCYTRLSSTGTCRYYCGNVGSACTGSNLTCRRLGTSDIGACAP